MLDKYLKNLVVLLIAVTIFGFSALVAFACKPTITPTPSTTPTPTPTVTPTCTPTPTPTPKSYYFTCDRDNDACIKVEGIGESTCTTRDDCKKVTPTPTPTPSITPTPTIDPCANGGCVTPTPTSSNSGGPGDGLSDNLGCSTHDCSGNKVGGGNQAVLGASTGPQVLGLSTTSGEENYLLQFAQIFGALISSGLGLAFFKKNG